MTTSDLLFWIFVAPWILGAVVYILVAVIAVVAHGIAEIVAAAKGPR